MNARSERRRTTKEWEELESRVEDPTPYLGDRERLHRDYYPPRPPEPHAAQALVAPIPPLKESTNRPSWKSWPSGRGGGSGSVPIATTDCLISFKGSSGAWPGVALLVIGRLRSRRAGSRFGAGDRLQSVFEPRRKCVVSQLAPGHVRHGVGDDQILDRQPIAASDRQQFHEVQSRALVPVDEAVIGNDAVDQSGRLLVDARVVAVVGAGDRRLDRRTVENPGCAACQ